MTTHPDELPPEPAWPQPGWSGSPALAYGDLAVMNRAVLLLLRQVREINAWIEWFFNDNSTEEEARARTTDIDALLAEIVALGRRRIEEAQDGQEER